MNRITIDSTLLVLALLLGLTLAGYGFGQSAWGGASLAALGLALVKGQMVIDRFMGLARVAGPWRWALSGWLAFVLGLIALASVV